MRAFIILCRSNSLGSKFLRLVMWSRWSHSALYDFDTGQVYDSTLLQGGVKVRQVTDFLDLYPDHELRLVEVPEPEAQNARDWLAAQVGKGYDWSALLGFLFQRNWQETDRWFCSELTETFRGLFSTPKLRSGAWRVTPHHQDIVL